MPHYTPKLYAILGATCSGKSALALQLAPHLNACIFSLDSLCIYKEIDIASAKPSPKELALIPHFAINVVNPNEHVSANLFLNLLYESIEYCKQNRKNLLIVGGSSFYLKAIMQGLSPMPHVSAPNASFLAMLDLPLDSQYDFLAQIDSEYAAKINPHDTYRIQKALEIFFHTNCPPTQFFAQNPPQPFPLPIQLFIIAIDRALLAKRIVERAHNMYESGILGEAQRLLDFYGESIAPFKSIGLKECLLVLQQKLDEGELIAQIATHTRQLAKRQTTFNRTQFHESKTIHFPFHIESILGDMLRQ